MPEAPLRARFTDLRARLLRLAERRLPALTRLREAEPLPIRLDRRRIYVLPTRFGLGLGALLFVMLLGALNYGNNPAFLLTCLFGAAAWSSLFFGFRTLLGTCVAQLAGNEAHAGDPLPLHVHFAPGRARANLRLRCAGVERAFALPADRTGDIELALPPAPRGWFRPGRLRLWTDHPLGLFQCWSWIHPAIDIVVYPRPEQPAPPLPSGDGHQGERSGTGNDEDFAGLRDYRPHDPPRLIAWKASARHDSLLTRESEPLAGQAVVLDYAATAPLDAEARLSRLTAWVLAAESLQRRYTLQLPGLCIGPGLGTSHRQACLHALALHEPAAP
jgi:uncharacterized protein (DUF58 family)